MTLFNVCNSGLDVFVAGGIGEADPSSLTAARLLWAACFFQFLIARIRRYDGYRHVSEHRERISMALFRTSEKSVVKDRDTAKANRDRLAATLHEAEANVVATKSAVQRAALAGDDGTLDAAEAAEAASLRRHGTIAGARAKAEEVLAVLEGQVAAALDAKVRAATAAAIEAIADEIEKSGDSFAIGAAALAEAAKHAALVTPDAAGLSNFASNVMAELPPAIRMTAQMLRSQAAAVLTGAAPAAMPTPEAVVKPVVLVQPLTRRLFATRPVKWTDAAGQLRISPQFADVDLPIACADRAIVAKACVAMTDPARNKQTHNTWPGHPSPDHCFSLDEPDGTAKADDAPKPLAEPVVVFQPVDRGKPFTLKIAAGGA
jgi:hypothetical protein